MNSEKQSTNLQMTLRGVNRVGEGQKNVPKLRFKGYEDAWEQRKLGEIVLSEIKGSAKAEMIGGDTPYLETNYLNGGECLFVDSENNVDTDDVIVLWDGSQAGTVYHGFSGALGSTFKAYKTKCLGLFIFQQLKKNQQTIYDKYRTPNIPHVIKTFKDEYDVMLTSEEEQNEIGRYFQQIDHLITLHQRKYDALKSMKKTLLSKIFPKNGEDVPEISFKGYTDAWEQRKVSEITKFHKQGYYTTEEYNDNKKYYLLRGTDLTGNKLVLKDTPKIDATEKDYDAFKTEIGDFLIVRSGNVGTYGIVDVDIPAIFGSYLIDFRFDTEKVTNEFFGYFYQSERFQSQLNKITQSSANINVNAENIKSTYIFNSLENIITLHQRKLDELKNMKKTLLQQMFV